MLVAVLAGCVDAEAQVSTVTADNLDFCHDREQLRGCCDAGGSCTWFAPVEASCTSAFTSFCASGLAWCSDSVCRPFCAVASFPRCGAGLVEHHEAVPGAKPGEPANVCVCVPG